MPPAPPSISTAEPGCACGVRLGDAGLLAGDLLPELPLALRDLKADDRGP